MGKTKVNYLRNRTHCFKIYFRGTYHRCACQWLSNAPCDVGRDVFVILCSSSHCQTTQYNLLPCTISISVTRRLTKTECPPRRIYESNDMSQTPSKLTPLLPTTPYVLAYTLPLLLLSVLLTFAGTFLTIDRSRSFTPRSDASSYSSLPGAFDHPKKKRRFSWLLDGGIGGLASGYAFGRMSFLSHQYLQVYIDNYVFSSPSLYPPCSSHTCDIFLRFAIFQIIPCRLDPVLYSYHLHCRTIQVRRCAIIECIRRVR